MKLTIEKIMVHFKWKALNKESAIFSRTIETNAISRRGLELAGVKKKISAYKKTIIGWGTHEFEFLLSLPKNERILKLKYLLDENVPAIFFSKGFQEGDIFEEIFEIANNFKIPIFKIHENLSCFSSKIIEFFSQHLNETEVAHASLIVINGVGVLIKGKSGIGKSEAILELIQKGQIFIGDDSIEIYKNNGEYYGKPMPLTKDLLEVRGIGLINVPFIYGIKSVALIAKIEIVVELLSASLMNEVDRLGDQNLKAKILDGELPLFQIPTGSGRSVASLIEAASSVYAAKKEGMDPLKTIKLRRDNDK